MRHRPCVGSSPMAAIVVAACALAFTVGSFWWIQLRRGNLQSYEPQTYSGYIQASSFRLRLPLTIYNTGARTLVVTDLRVLFVAPPQSLSRPSPFDPTIKPLSSDTLDFVHPFAVPGRQAVTSSWSSVGRAGRRGRHHVRRQRGRPYRATTGASARTRPNRHHDCCWEERQRLHHAPSRPSRQGLQARSMGDA